MTDTESKKAEQAEESRADKMPRRDFLTRSSGVVLACCGIAATAGAVRMTVPEVADGPPARFPIGSLSDFKMRTLTWLRDEELFLVRDEQGFGAFSSRCTHLGCTVRRASDGFHCPCHGARFDPRGKVMAGPARRDLPWFKLWIEGDAQLWVDTSVEVEALCVPVPVLRRAGGGLP